MYKIYYLYDKENPTIPKYIGSSKQKYLTKRKAQHIEKSKLGARNSKKDKWINRIGFNVGIQLLEDAIETKEEALKREDFYINKFKETITNTGGAKTIPPNKGGWNTIELSQETIDRLGKEPDYVIANSLGVDKGVIARKRKHLKIKSYATQTGNNGKFKHKGNKCTSNCTENK